MKATGRDLVLTLSTEQVNMLREPTADEASPHEIAIGVMTCMRPMMTRDTSNWPHEPIKGHVSMMPQRPYAGPFPSSDSASEPSEPSSSPGSSPPSGCEP